MVQCLPPTSLLLRSEVRGVGCFAVPSPSATGHRKPSAGTGSYRLLISLSWVSLAWWRVSPKRRRKLECAHHWPLTDGDRQGPLVHAKEAYSFSCIKIAFLHNIRGQINTLIWNLGIYMCVCVCVCVYKIHNLIAKTLIYKLTLHALGWVWGALYVFAFFPIN